MTQPRILGQILVDDFGWAQTAVDRAVLQKDTDPGPKQRLGHYLRRGGSQTGDLPLALVLQQHERMMFASRGAFDGTEYAELGTLYRFEVDEMHKRLKAYAVLMLTLILYIAYPLRYLVGDPVSATVGPGLLGLYSALGLCLVVLSMCLGDYLLKSYGQFIKRRWRISRARSAIRGAQIAAGTATQTAMPHRRADESAKERPDPSIGGYQKYLPILYSGWCFVKLGLATFFAASLWQGSFRLSIENTYRGIASVLLFGPFWIQAVSSMCEHYHKYLKEAVAVSATKPFPNASTAHLRVPGGKWWQRIEVWAYLFLGSTGITACLAAIAFGPQTTLALGNTVVQVQSLSLAAAAVLMFTYFIFRVADVSKRMKQVQMLP